MSKFTRRHYEALAEGMAIMAHGLERMSERLAIRGKHDNTVIKTGTAIAVMDAMCAVFEADNPAFSRTLFRKKFAHHYCIELRNLDNSCPAVYNIADEDNT